MSNGGCIVAVGLLMLWRLLLLLLLLLLLRLSHPCKCVRDDWSEPIHNMHLLQHVITHSENTADACSKPQKARANLDELPSLCEKQRHSAAHEFLEFRDADGV